MDKNLGSVKAKLQGQAHRLAAACDEYFGGLVHFYYPLE
jgi:hypothetical protein